MNVVSGGARLASSLFNVEPRDHLSGCKPQAHNFDSNVKTCFASLSCIIRPFNLSIGMELYTEDALSKLKQ